MNILDQLKGVRQSRNGWEAKCPAHDDAHCSLSVAHRDGKWLLNCHAGCSIDAIVSALGIQRSDLFDAPKRKATGKGNLSVVAEYIYRTAEGEFSRKVCRTADKQFPQFKWTGSKWQSGAEGLPILPYRLPELTSAAPETPVFICEGEKDCDRLAALGFVATTNPMGAGKWRAGLNKWFADRIVFVIPDNDEPGRKHAADIMRYLKLIAARVRVVELPGLTKKGGDVSDWLDADAQNKNRLIDVATAPSVKQRPCDGAALLDDVNKFLGRFVVYPSIHAQVAHALWIAHTHVMDAWESTPRIAFLSPEPASGKTRALEVSVLLVPNPVEAINVTPAYLFRKVGGEVGLPTILYDEIDTVFGPKAKDNEEVRALLNAGHRRGAVAGRCVVRGKTIETEEIPAYCAVALAGLGWLPETILSRSILVHMRRRAPGERIQPFRRRLCLRDGEQLRKRLAEWGAFALDHVADNWPELPADIADRDADVWEPIIALADLAGGNWPERARAAAVEIVKTEKDREPSLGIRLLADLRTVFGDRAQMSTTDILAGLMRIDEAPWADLKGKPLNDRGLSRRLRQYGVKSGNIRVDGGTALGGILKGYKATDLNEAWSRYLPSSDNSATIATSATDGENPNKTAVSCSGSEQSPSATKATGSATKPLPVADDAGHVADDVATEALAKPLKNMDCSAVADVALLAGNGGEPAQTFARVCQHCGNPEWPGKPVEPYSVDGETYLLHPNCRQDWLAGPNPEGWSFNLDDARGEA